MSKRDVLDRELARQFAWRTAEPEVPATNEEKAPAEPPDPEAQRQHAEYAAERCKELAEGVARAWALTSLPEQAAATKRLMRLAARASLDLVRMDDHPLEAVRLWRLVVRHPAARPRLHTLFPLGFMPVSSRQREVVDLIVEAAETGSSDLSYMLDQQVATQEVGRRHPELGARLAHIVDTGKTWEARELAARWLSLDEFPAAIPALRRALRKPRARLRFCALFILEQMEGGLLQEDVMWLLEDAVNHPLSRGMSMRGFERVQDYENALVAAVKKAPPPEGWRPLEIIANGGGAHIHRMRDGLDSGWALRALAAGYPERAVGRIDRELVTLPGLGRYDAIDAVGLLPDELARPRLLAAAGHDDHRVLEKAKRLWFARFGAEWPAEPLAGVPVELLAEAPSERLFACLTVLRGKSDEARHAMIDALLAEVPEVPEGEAPPESLSPAQREVLALLLFAVQHRGRLFKHPTLTTSEEGWVRLLLRRFGPPAFDALVAIAERHAMAGAPRGWLSALATVAREGLLTEAQKGRLRDVARAALASPAWQNAPAPLDVLSVVGAPADLEERLWSIAVQKVEHDPESDDGAQHASWLAFRVLLEMRDAPGLDARAAQEAEKARAAGDWGLFDSLLPFGGERGAAAVLDVAERAVADYDGDPKAFGPVYRAACALEKAGRIDDGWVLERLRQPESPAFPIAVHLAWQKTPDAARAALREALGSTARGGAAAAEAAQPLVAQGELALDDARLEGILERAPEHARADLLTTMIDSGASLAACRRHLEPLLLAPGGAAERDLLDALYCKRPEGMYELFEELLPRVRSRNVRAVMEHVLRAPGEAAGYWKDGDDDEEEDDFDDFDDEEDDDALD